MSGRAFGGIVVCGAALCLVGVRPTSASDLGGAAAAKSVVLAYIHAEQRGDWTAVCSLKNPVVLRAAGSSSIAKCAKGYPSLLDAGTGFLGFIRRGTATVRAVSARQTGSGRAKVFVLWRVYPWRRDAVQMFLMDRIGTGTTLGPYRISDEEWAPKQVWPQP